MTSSWKLNDESAKLTGVQLSTTNEELSTLINLCRLCCGFAVEYSMESNQIFTILHSADWLMECINIAIESGSVPVHD